jgi:hypothetical protein
VAGPIRGGSPPTLSPMPTTAELRRIANEPDPRAAGFTRAGRALQKHGYRPTGSSFPRVTGPPARYNERAARIVDAILDDPGSSFTTRWKRRQGRLFPFVEVKTPAGPGLGFIWDATLGRYVLDGFREP